MSRLKGVPKSRAISATGDEYLGQKGELLDVPNLQGLRAADRSQCGFHKQPRVPAHSSGQVLSLLGKERQLSGHLPSRHHQSIPSECCPHAHEQTRMLSSPRRHSNVTRQEHRPSEPLQASSHTAENRCCPHHIIDHICSRSFSRGHKDVSCVTSVSRRESLQDSPIVCLTVGMVPSFCSR